MELNLSEEEKKYYGECLKQAIDIAGGVTENWGANYSDIPLIASVFEKIATPLYFLRNR